MRRDARGALSRHRPAGARSARSRPLEGHHEQGARRRARACRRRARTASSPPRSSSFYPRYAAGHALPGVLRRRLGRGEPRSSSSCRAPSRTAATEALQALEHFDDAVCPGHRLPGEGGARGDAAGGTARSTSSATTPPDGARRRDGARASSSATRTPRCSSARDAAEAKRFWADRKRLGAIARRTNAFKLNEDSCFRWMRSPNSRAGRRRSTSRRSARIAELALRLRDFFERGAARTTPRRPTASCPWRSRCARGARGAVGEGARKCAATTGLDEPAARCGTRSRVRRCSRRASSALERTSATAASSLATHMHAGDGNVHVNVPVLSNDRAMLRGAEAVGRPADGPGHRLGGVSPASTASASRSSITSSGAARRAQRLPARGGSARHDEPRQAGGLAALELIFTPSFNLLELEARILLPRAARGIGAADRALRALRQVQARLLRLLPGRAASSSTRATRTSRSDR